MVGVDPFLVQSPWELQHRCVAKISGSDQHAIDVSLNFDAAPHPAQGFGTYHALPPEAISRWCELVGLAFYTCCLLVPRQNNRNWLSRHSKASATPCSSQFGDAILPTIATDNNHTQSKKAITEENGREENDHDEQDGELPILDPSADSQAQI